MIIINLIIKVDSFDNLASAYSVINRVFYNNDVLNIFGIQRIYKVNSIFVVIIRLLN